MKYSKIIYLPQRNKDNQSLSKTKNELQSIEENIKFIKMTIMDIKIYLVDQLTVQFSLKQIQDIREKLKNYEKENEELKRITVY